MKAELEAQQNLERIRMEKMVQSGALTSTKSRATQGKSQTRGNATNVEDTSAMGYSP